MIGWIELTFLCVIGYRALKYLAPENDAIDWAEENLQDKKYSHLPRIQCERCPKLIPLGLEHAWVAGLPIDPQNKNIEDLCSDCHMILCYYTYSYSDWYNERYPKPDYKPSMMGECLWFCYGDID